MIVCMCMLLIVVYHCVLYVYVALLLQPPEGVDLVRGDAALHRGEHALELAPGDLAPDLGEKRQNIQQTNKLN